MNDMSESISSYLYMCADDTNVGRQVSSDVDHSALQSDLDNLVAWSKE